MAINMTQQTLGYFLMVLGVFIAIAGYISYRKGGRMKVITYVVSVIVCLGLGAKFAFTPKEEPVEIKQTTFPKSSHR